MKIGRDEKINIVEGTLERENEIDIPRGAVLAERGDNNNRVYIGIAAQDMKPGVTFIIDLMKGPKQLIWPNDGKEMIITAEEPTTKQLKEKETNNGKRH